MSLGWVFMLIYFRENKKFVTFENRPYIFRLILSIFPDEDWWYRMRFLFDVNVSSSDVKNKKQDFRETKVDMINVAFLCNWNLLVTINWPIIIIPEELIKPVELLFLLFQERKNNMCVWVLENSMSFHRLWWLNSIFKILVFN